MTNVGSQVANYDVLGGYIEGSCGKYTKTKNKTGHDDITQTKFWFEPQTVGARVFCVLSAWNDPDSMLGRLKLSGDVAAIKEFLADSSISAARWSLILQDGNLPGGFRVVSCWTNDGELTAGYVSLNREIRIDKCGIARRDVKDGAVTYTLSSGWDTESKYLDIWNNGLIDENDNSFYCSTHPNLGNQISPFFKFAHCEGNANRAIQRFDHAEGRKNIIDGRYSHVEGCDNISYGWNSHVEGFNNRNYNAYNHVEGELNVAYTGKAHVEGVGNAVGLSTDFPGAYEYITHVNGYNNRSVHSDSSMVTGNGNLLSGGSSNVVAGVRNTVVDTNTSIVGGNGIVVLSCNDVVASGQHLDVAGMNHSFVWSGKSVSQTDHTKWYGYAADSAGVRKAAFPGGSFCINPQNGINGFYIGNQSLSAIIGSAIEAALKAKGL